MGEFTLIFFAYLFIYFMCSLFVMLVFINSFKNIRIKEPTIERNKYEDFYERTVDAISSSTYRLYNPLKERRKEDRRKSVSHYHPERRVSSQCRSLSVGEINDLSMI